MRVTKYKLSLLNNCPLLLQLMYPLKSQLTNVVTGTEITNETINCMLMNADPSTSQLQFIN